MTLQDSCYLYTLSFLLISLIFEISKTLLTTWRQRTRQGELYLLDYVDLISSVFKLDHWNVYMYVSVSIYTCILFNITLSTRAFHCFRLHCPMLSAAMCNPKSGESKMASPTSEKQGGLCLITRRKWITQELWWKRVFMSSHVCQYPGLCKSLLDSRSAREGGWANHPDLIFPPKKDNTQPSWSRKQGFRHPWKVSYH